MFCRWFCLQRLIEAATQGDDEQIVKLLEGGRVNLHHKDWVNNPCYASNLMSLYACMWAFASSDSGFELNYFS